MTNICRLCLDLGELVAQLSLYTHTIYSLSWSWLNTPHTRHSTGPTLCCHIEHDQKVNPIARAQLDKTGSYLFLKKLPTLLTFDEANVQAVSKLLEFQGSMTGIGVDQGRCRADCCMVIAD